MKDLSFRCKAVVFCAMFASINLLAQSLNPPVKLTLSEAIDRALKNNHALLVAAAKVDEMKSAKRVAASDYFPRISEASTYEHHDQRDLLQFGPGAFGTFPILGPIPQTSLIVQQGSLDQILSRTQASQPLTQLIKIHEANKVAQAGLNASRESLRSAQQQIAIGVRQLYYGILIAQTQYEQAQAQVESAKEELAESSQAVTKGNALEVEELGAKAAVLQAEQQQLKAQIELSGLKADFDNLIGLPNASEVELEYAAETAPSLPDKGECIRLAESGEPEILAAEEEVKKVRSALAAARAEYIPDISAFYRHDYQDGIPFFFHNYDVVGVGLTYEVFTGGKKGNAIRERQAQLTQAQENLARLKDDAAVKVEKALDKVQQSKQLLAVAQQVIDLRKEGVRLAEVQLKYEAIVHSKLLSAEASLAQSKVDLLRAELGYSEAVAEVQLSIGLLPR
jgi:outer membrane protein TolC